MHLVGFGEIGTYLRESREALGIPPERPVRDLHLRPSYIEAIETGHIEGLPGAAYARGYIGKYADYLGVDKRMVLAAFDQALHFRGASPYPEPTRRDARPGAPILLVCGVLLLLLMGAWRLLWPAASKPAEEATQLPVAAAPALLPGPMPRATARECWAYLPPPEGAKLACYRADTPKILGLQPKMRYSSELQISLPPRD